MKLLIILGLAAMAAAASTSISPSAEQIVRIGTVGVVIADVKGKLVPKGDSSSAVPVFEFKSTEAPAEQDSEYFKYRCNVITEYFNPKSTQPILLCRNSDFNKGTKQTFLFSHGGLNLSPGVNEIEVMVGKSTVANFSAMYSLEVPERRKKPLMEGIYDGFYLQESRTSKLESLLDYKI